MFRRRQYLIDTKYQARFVAGGIVYIAAITVCLSLPFIPLTNSMTALLVDAPDEVAEMVGRQQAWAKATFALCSLWLMAAWSIFATFRSHKIAGPVYHLVRVMQKVKKGHLDARVHLRKGDDLKAIEAGLNEMLDGIAAREESAKKRLKEYLRREQGGPSPEQIDRAIAHAYPEPEPVPETPEKPGSEPADELANVTS
jgi:HAMP domain-containing protein